MDVLGPRHLTAVQRNYETTAAAPKLNEFLPVKQLSAGHQLQHQRNVGVRLEDFLQLDLSHKRKQTFLSYVMYVRFGFFCIWLRVLGSITFIFHKFFLIP